MAAVLLVDGMSLVHALLPHAASGRELTDAMLASFGGSGLVVLSLTVPDHVPAPVQPSRASGGAAQASTGDMMRRLAPLFPVEPRHGAFQVGEHAWPLGRAERGWLLEAAALEWQLRRWLTHSLASAVAEGRAPPALRCLMIDQALWMPDEAAHARLRAFVAQSRTGRSLATPPGSPAAAASGPSSEGYTLASLVAHYSHHNCCRVTIEAGQRTPTLEPYYVDAPAGSVPPVGDGTLRLLHMYASSSGGGGVALLTDHPDALLMAMLSPAGGEGGVTLHTTGGAVAVVGDAQAQVRGGAQQLFGNAKGGGDQVFIALLVLLFGISKFLPSAGGEDALWRAVSDAVECAIIGDWAALGGGTDAGTAVRLLEYVAQRCATPQLDRRYCYSNDMVVAIAMQERDSAANAGLALATEACVRRALEARWLLAYYRGGAAAAGTLREAGWQRERMPLVADTGASSLDGRNTAALLGRVYAQTQWDERAGSPQIEYAALEHSPKLMARSPSVTALRRSDTGVWR